MVRSCFSCAGFWRSPAIRLVAAACWIVSCHDAFALDRQVFDCGEPFSNATCVLSRYSSSYDYWFGRYEGQPARGPNPLGPPYAGSTDVDKLYDLAGQYQQYLLTKFGRNGPNGLGGTGDGTRPGFATGTFSMVAHYNGAASTQQSGACDGGNGAYAFSSPGYASFCAGSVNENAFGHEFTHILSNLYLDADIDNIHDVLLSETGAISESYSDFFGEAFERYVTGNTDWLNTWPDGTVIRSLSNPTAISQTGYPSSDRYLSPAFDVAGQRRNGCDRARTGRRGVSAARDCMHCPNAPPQFSIKPRPVVAGSARRL